MPEGDTIHQTAHTLSRAIGGRRVMGWRSALAALEDADLVGRTVETVEARGKHLLVRFDDGRTLHTHMRMDGSWHIYRPGERWPIGAHRAHAVIETEAWIAVCFDAPICALVRGEPEMVARLGPDLLDPDADLDEALRRLRAHPDLPLGVAVMRQDLVSGIGNVYKSEVLFIRRRDPFATVADIGDDALRDVLLEARRLLRINLGRPRRTRHRLRGDPHWVYGRSGKPCFECGGSVAMTRQGDLGRSTYYCPTCQGRRPQRSAR
ncbi:MAG: Fpg/Nei family DNA glycosylase [Myxococcales bacterium]|nr:Fpg/Nei family DNA glycosylase [Myxococcales bacterium]